MHSSVENGSILFALFIWKRLITQCTFDVQLHLIIILKCNEEATATPQKVKMLRKAQQPVKR